MCDIPDPDEEFELMYGDDMDMAFELEGNTHGHLKSSVNPGLR